MKPSKFVTTSQWGANDARDATPTSHPIGPDPGITFHWIGPGRGGTWDHSRCAHIVQSIERHHEFGNGWADIAYNALPCPHGYVFEGRGARVRSSANGSTASNRSHYAVCYLGGQGDPFTDEGKAAFVEAVHWLRSEGGANNSRPNGHRDHKATDCPGDVIYQWRRTADFTQREDWFDMATKDELREIVAEEIDKALSKKQTNGKSLRNNIRAGGNSPALIRELGAKLGHPFGTSQEE